MSELDAELQRGLLFTHDCLLKAIVATHPNPSLLKEAFLHNSNQWIDSNNNTINSETFPKIIRMHVAEMLKAFPPDHA